MVFSGVGKSRLEGFGGDEGEGTEFGRAVGESRAA